MQVTDVLDDFIIEGDVFMVVEGVQLHTECGGLGIIEKDGKGEVCVECMGTGMIYVEIEIE